MDLDKFDKVYLEHVPSALQCFLEKIPPHLAPTAFFFPLTHLRAPFLNWQRSLVLQGPGFTSEQPDLLAAGVHTDVQHLVLGSAFPASQASPASITPLPQTARLELEKSTGGGTTTDTPGDLVPVWVPDWEIKGDWVAEGATPDGVSEPEAAAAGVEEAEGTATPDEVGASEGAAEEAAPPEGAAEDAAPPEGAADDAAAPEGAADEAAAPEGAAEDAAAPDGAAEDAAPPDGALDDGAAPDAASDVPAPEGAAEEGAAPEAGAEPVPEGVPAALWREPETDAEPERDPEVVTEVVTDGVMEVVPEID